MQKMIDPETNSIFEQLVEPNGFQRPLNVGDFSKNFLINAYKKMNLIRLTEVRLAEARRDGHIGGPVHLGVGQEAVAVGVSSHLRKTDRVFGAHRSHSHFMALGATPHSLFAEVLGKNTGASRGMGGSMHLWDASIGFHGSVPIVAGTVPLAVGAGLSAKMQKTKDVSVAYFGDGALEEGVVHESLNLARVYNVPTLFVVENNLFASHMHISLRQPRAVAARFAAANDIPFKIVDGNNLVEVSQASQELLDYSRSGKGPGFLEAVTYRWYGHVDWREDIDVGVHRSEEDLRAWKVKDPIARLREALCSQGLWSENKEGKLLKTLSEQINSAWTQAMADPYPDDEELLSRVYSGRLNE